VLAGSKAFGEHPSSRVVFCWKRDGDAARCLRQCRIAPSKPVGGLTERQRRELIGLFRR
jgi:hypothetical protein